MAPFMPSVLPLEPLTGDENTRAIDFELNWLFDGDARRAANPNKPPYKPELLAKVADLDLHENQVDPADHTVPSGRHSAGRSAGAHRAGSGNGGVHVLR